MKFRKCFLKTPQLIRERIVHFVRNLRIIQNMIFVAMPIDLCAKFLNALFCLFFAYHTRTPVIFGYRKSIARIPSGYGRRELLIAFPLIAHYLPFYILLLALWARPTA